MTLGHDLSVQTELLAAFELWVQRSTVAKCFRDPQELSMAALQDGGLEIADSFVSTAILVYCHVATVNRDVSFSAWVLAMTLIMTNHLRCSCWLHFWYNYNRLLWLCTSGHHLNSLGDKFDMAALKRRALALCQWQICILSRRDRHSRCVYQRVTNWNDVGHAQTLQM
jgi:hypothetical protein